MKKSGYIIIGIILVAVLGYGAYSYFQPMAPAATQNDWITDQKSLDELPEVTPSPVVSATPGTTTPAASPTPTSIKKLPEKILIPAQSATPANISSDPFIQQGRQLLTQGKYAEARDAFNQAAPSATATYYQGLIASYFGERAPSVDALTALKTMPDADAKLLENGQKILDSYTLFDTYQDGRQEFLAALISKQLLSIGEVDLAIGKLEYILNKVPDYTDVSTLLGSAYLVKGNYERAITVLTDSLPNDRPEVYYWLGIAHLYQESYNKAIGAFQLALNKGYQPAFKPHEKIADTYLSLNNFVQAAAAYESALQTADGQDYIDLYVRPVWVYIDKLRQPSDALRLANQAVLRFPRSAMAHNLLGWSQVASGNYADAKVALDKAVALDPTLAAIYLNLGSYYRAQNDLAGAINAYQSAVQYDKQGSIANAARNILKSLETLQPTPSPASN